MSLVVGANYVSQRYAGQPAMAERLRKLHTVTEEFRNGLGTKTDQIEITFGTVVKLVDYIRDPYNKTHMSSTGDGFPTDSASCNLEFLRRVGTDPVIGASHSNVDHFQGRAMYAFWFWHREAVRQAQEGNLWGGLLLEAYANHFLEDLFAPGHILTPRDENAHDVYTLTLHDFYNKRGLDYVVGAPAQLVGIVKSMEALVRANTLTMPPKPKAGSARRLDLRLEAVQEFARTLGSGKVRIACHGDDLLKQNPQQLPLVVSYCARSISDVLESYLQATEVNSFKRYHWHVKFFPMQVNRADIEAIDVRLGWGSLYCVDNPQTIGQEGRLAWASGDKNEKSRNRDTFPITLPLNIDAYHNPVVTLHTGVQTIALSSETHIRALYEAEVMVFGKRFDAMRPDWEVPGYLPGQIAVTLGYSGVAGAGEPGNGGYVRGMIPIPRLNMNFRVIAGARSYGGGWGDFEKVRFEWGLHMASMFLGVGRETYGRSRGGLSEGTAVEVGFNLDGPVSAIRRLLPGKKKSRE